MLWPDIPSQPAPTCPKGTCRDNPFHICGKRKIFDVCGVGSAKV